MPKPPRCGAEAASEASRRGDNPPWVCSEVVGHSGVHRQWYFTFLDRLRATDLWVCWADAEDPYVVREGPCDARCIAPAGIVVCMRHGGHEGPHSAGELTWRS